MHQTLKRLAVHPKALSHAATCWCFGRDGNVVVLTGGHRGRAARRVLRRERRLLGLPQTKREMKAILRRNEATMAIRYAGT